MITINDVNEDPGYHGWGHEGIRCGEHQSISQSRLLATYTAADPED